MKKTALLTVMGLTLFMAACGDNNDDDDAATNVPDDAPQEQEGSTSTNTVSDNNSEESPFAFTHFDLDVEYAGNKSYDVDYENESTGAEAKIEDDFNNNIIQGNDAIDQLMPIFENFTFDASTPDDQIIEEVLSAFNLSNDYQEFELEVRFADGVQKEINRKQ